MNEGDLEALKGQVTIDVTAKLSHTKSKLNDLKVEMAKQSEARMDTSSTLQDLLVSITNPENNVSKMHQEMTYR